MKPTRARSFPLLLLASLTALGSAAPLACGGAPEAKTPGVPVASTAAKPAAPPVDLSAVPAPDSLAVLVRVAKPTDTLTVVAELLRPVAPMVEALTVKDLTTLWLGDAIADVVDSTRPLDAVFARESKVRGGEGVLSMGVLSFDDAMKNLAEDFELTPRGNGVVALMPLASATLSPKTPPTSQKKKKRGKKAASDDAAGDDDGSSKPVCELWPAAGESPYRLLCGLDPAVILAAGPYLTRTVARTKAASDLHVELMPGSIHSALKAAMDRDPPTSPAGAFGARVFFDLVKEIRGMSGDASLSRGESALTVTTHLSSTESVGSHVLGVDPTRVKATPSAFFQLPSDSTAAFYTQGTKPDELAAFREEFLGLAEEDILSDGKDVDVSRKLFEVLRKLTFKGGPFVAATGFDETALRAALAAKAPKSGIPTIPRNALHGWTLVESDEAASPWITEIRGLLAFEKSHPSAKKTRTNDDESKDETDVREVKVTTQDALPPGTAHFEVRRTPVAPTTKGKKAGKPLPPHSMHIFIAEAKGADGPQTWFGAGEDAALVRTKLRGALAIPPATAGASTTQLAGRAGLDALRGSSSSWGGFFLPSGTHWIDLPDAPPTDAEGFDALTTAVAKLPATQKVATPIVITAEAAKEKGAAPQGGAQLTIQARFPRAVTDSLIKLGSELAKH